jgi:hypothetical protein
MPAPLATYPQISIELALATRLTAPTMPVPLDQDQTPQAPGSSLPALYNHARVDAALVLDQPSPDRGWCFEVAHSGYFLACRNLYANLYTGFGRTGKNSHKIWAFMVINGGQGGIRTRGGCYTTHAFQACALNRSATCPTHRFLEARSAALIAWWLAGATASSQKPGA